MGEKMLLPQLDLVALLVTYPPCDSFFPFKTHPMAKTLNTTISLIKIMKLDLFLFLSPLSNNEYIIAN